MHFIETPIEYLKGVGPSRADLLKKELRIFTYGDLLHHFPFRYIDRSRYYNIKDLNIDLPSVQLKGQFIRFEEKGQKKGKRLIGYFKDETGVVELVWFKGIKWIKAGIKVDINYVVFGKISYFKGKFNIVHPEIDVLEELDKRLKNLQPVYHSTELLNAKGLGSRALGRLTKSLLNLMNHQLEETLSEQLISKLNLPTREQSFFDIHHPTDSKSLIRAQKRLKFEEFFFLQLHLIKLKITRINKSKGYAFNNIGNNFNDFYKKYLPFKLTNAQKKVLKEIRNDVRKPQQMNRLLQGDVGSGKTLVALLSMLIAIDNSFQTCLMAPTEILAQQHFNSISQYLEKLKIKIAFLTGSTKKKERNIIYEQLINGEINLIIGTHALIEEKVQFKNLGLAIIDEQHRFGVAQRAKLWKKNNNPPHVLVMTATPIPRTLSMTLYGDLDVSIIDELPPGRKEVQTIWKSDSSRLQVIDFMRKQITKGRQIYIVFPLIEESEKLDYKDLFEGFKAIEREFPLPDFQVSILHGRMKSEEKEYEMKRFVDGITNILVATTVIEVGVNVPNASVMIIESAERFGLSQLHQLRGRVGRGAEQSYCILMSGYKVSNEGKTRLKTMVETNDGFRISEVDLKLRGPGDILGTRQSGLINLKISSLVKDYDILNLARKEAESILINDLDLLRDENMLIRNFFTTYHAQLLKWGTVS